MPRYYQVDRSRITFREYWNITRSPNVLIAWIAKVLRIPLGPPQRFALPDSFREIEVAPEALQPAAMARLQPLIEECARMGFHSPKYYRFLDLAGTTETSLVSMLHASGEAVARLFHTVSSVVSPPRQHVLSVFLSRLSEGQYLVSASDREKFSGPADIITRRKFRATPTQLWQIHQEALSHFRMRNPPRPVGTDAGRDELVDGYERHCTDFGVQRGRYVPMSEEQIAGAQQRAQAVREMAAAGVQHAEILAELQQVQEKKRGWGSAVLIFAVSAGLFVAAGARQWSWNYLLMLIPVLLIHEIGHYLAMRGFNYSNVRMFFIPFFGAAVAGRHYNVPGWKKVIVSMMGPLPGILLGALLGSAGLILHQPLMVRLALVALILNGLNLVPILPFDGGWIAHTLVFSRHHLLDAAFRVIAVAALALGGIFSHDKILMYLCIPMAIGIPLAFRMARVTTILRRQGLPAAAPDDQTIPRETAQAIITEVKKVLPNPHTNKMVAEHTLRIFETLNAQPPGWLATAAFLLLHVGAMAMAGLFVILLMVAQAGVFGGFPLGHRVLRHPIACSSISTAREGAESQETGVNTIVATFKSRKEAQARLADIQPRVKGRAGLFGDTLFITIAADDNAQRKQWMQEMGTRQVAMDSTNLPLTLSLECDAPAGTAQRIEEELSGYLSLARMHLMPPWAPAAVGESLTEEQRFARRTYHRLEKGPSDTPDDKELAALRRRISASQRQGDFAEVEQLQNKARDLQRARQKTFLDQMRSGQNGVVDTNLVALYVAHAELGITNGGASNLLERIAARMGQAREGSRADRTRAIWGAVFRTKNHLSVPFLTFRNLAEGAPSLVEWLCAQGCTNVRYDFSIAEEPE